MKAITCNIPDSLYDVLQERMETDKASCDHVVSVALSRYFGKSMHTLFQEPSKQFRQINSFSELVSVCDQLRDSNNVFYAFRVGGDSR
jgi:hypothetical protein